MRLWLTVSVLAFRSTSDQRSPSILVPHYPCWIVLDHAGGAARGITRLSSSWRHRSTMRSPHCGSYMQVFTTSLLALHARLAKEPTCFNCSLPTKPALSSGGSSTTRGDVRDSRPSMYGSAS